MKKGFSLVELIIVVGIIAIMATIGVSDYLSTRSQKRLELAAEVLVRELNLTMERSRSQEDGHQWWIHFDNPDGSNNDLYTVCYGTYTAPGADCAAEGGTESKRTILGAGLDFTEPASGTTKEIIFTKSTGLPVDADGLPATTLVTIKSTAAGGSKTITVNPNGSITF